VEAARGDAHGIVAKDPHLEDARNAPLMVAVRRSYGRDWEWVSSG
jgi:hypothetical protein